MYKSIFIAVLFAICSRSEVYASTALNEFGINEVAQACLPKTYILASTEIINTNLLQIQDTKGFVEKSRLAEALGGKKKTGNDILVKLLIAQVYFLEGLVDDYVASPLTIMLSQMINRARSDLILAILKDAQEVDGN